MRNEMVKKIKYRSRVISFIYDKKDFIGFSFLKVLVNQQIQT